MSTSLTCTKMCEEGEALPDGWAWVRELLWQAWEESEVSCSHQAEMRISFQLAVTLL